MPVVPRPPPHLRRAVLCVLGGTALTLPLLGLIPAKGNTFIGGGGTAPTWDQAANWDATHKPTATEDALFATPIPVVPGATISLGAAETANTLTFHDNYTLGSAAGAGDLTITTGKVTIAPGKKASIASQLTGTGG